MNTAIGKRLGFVSSENDGKHEIVPRENERQQRRRDDACSGHRQHDSAKHLVRRTAVDQPRFLDFLRQRLEERDHDPDDERKSDQHMAEHKRSIGIDQTQLGKYDVPRNQKGNAGNDPRHQNDHAHLL